MIITLGQGTLTSWKWMGSSLRALTGGVTLFKARSAEGAKYVWHVVPLFVPGSWLEEICSGLMIKIFLDNVMETLKFGSACRNPSTIYTNSDKQKDKQQPGSNKRIKYKISTVTINLSSCPLCCSQCRWRVNFCQRIVYFQQLIKPRCKKNNGRITSIQTLA